MENIYLLKDLSRITGYSTYTLKYYLQLGLFSEAGRSQETNFRYFNEATVEKLKHIRDLRAQRMSLKDIAVKINNQAST